MITAKVAILYGCDISAHYDSINDLINKELWLVATR